MPTPKIREGFYWVRVAEYDAAPFVAQRFADTWFSPGIEQGIDGRAVEVLSARLEPPAGTAVPELAQARRGKSRPSRSNTP